MPNSRNLFITGASRSGTTLMSFVLRKHQDILGLKELHYFGELCRVDQLQSALSEDQFLRAGASIFARQRDGILNPRATPDDYRMAGDVLRAMPEHERTGAGFFAAVVTRLSEDAGRKIPCEQTPRNIFYAQELLAAYEDCHIVHMMRDPRSVMASQKKRWQRAKLATEKSSQSYLRSLQTWINYHPYTSAKLWLRASSAANNLLGHPRFSIVRFEDLIESPEETVAGLCQRIGIEFKPEMLNVSQVNSSHRSSVGGARQGWNKAAIDAWRHTLSPAEVAIVERICGATMVKFGYSYGASLHGTDLVPGELRYRITYLGHAAGVLLVNPRRAWIQMQALVSRKTQ